MVIFQTLTEQQILEIPPSNSILFGLYYDACMALILALNSSIGDLSALNKSLDDFRYSDFQMASILNENVIKVNFIGVNVSIATLEQVSMYRFNNYFNRKNLKHTIIAWIFKPNLFSQLLTTVPLPRRSSVSFEGTISGNC